MDNLLRHLPEFRRGDHRVQRKTPFPTYHEEFSTMISFISSYRETLFVEVTDEIRSSEVTSDAVASDVVPPGESRGLAEAGIAGKLLYNASYAVSYSLTLPIFVAGRYLPKNNRLYEGLADGHSAANQAVDEFLVRARASRRARQRAKDEWREIEEIVEMGVGVLESS
jgi:hypothetical protein